MIQNLKVLYLFGGLALFGFGLFMAITMDVAADPLPERPTADANSLSNSSKRGSYLLLSVDDSDPDIISPDDDDWTVIQWQDNSGKWHAVDGWQGEYTYVVETNIWEVYWWVGEEHFGKGPFRWVVYTDATRETLEATSAPFDLPESRRDPVIISVRE